MQKAIGAQSMLEHWSQQAARPPHHFPVIFVGGPASQADLIVAAIVVDSRPREPVRAALPKKQFQEIHEVT
jgi:hypothetical protein